MATDSLGHLTGEQTIRLSALKIREAVLLGPDKSGIGGADRIMVAFATCDRGRWLPASNAGATELWAQLDAGQRAAVVQYLDGADVRAVRS